MRTRSMRAKIETDVSSQDITKNIKPDLTKNEVNDDPDVKSYFREYFADRSTPFFTSHSLGLWQPGIKIMTWSSILPLPLEKQHFDRLKYLSSTSTNGVYEISKNQFKIVSKSFEEKVQESAEKAAISLKVGKSVSAKFQNLLVRVELSSNF